MDNNFESIPKKEDFEEKAKILKVKVLKFARKDSVRFFSEVYEFGTILKSKYPDCLDYLAYHILIGSTPMKECPRFDFVGNDSVEKFLDSLKI